MSGTFPCPRALLAGVFLVSGGALFVLPHAAAAQANRVDAPSAVVEVGPQQLRANLINGNGNGNGNDKPSICHPVNGRGELGNGWNLIPPDQASSHIDEALYPGGEYWKHMSNDGLRHDVYANASGECPSPATWQSPQYPPFNPLPCTEYRVEKQTSTWNGETGTWSAWTDWPGAGPLDWGVVPNPMTGHHGGEHEKNGDRHYAYVVVGSRPVISAECVTKPESGSDERIDDGTCDGPGDGTATVTTYRTAYTYEWDGDSWAKVYGVEYVHSTEERSLSEKELDGCRPDNPEPDVETIDTGTIECGDTVMETQTTTINYVYEYNAETSTWDKVLSGTAQVSSSTRPLTAEELATAAADCPDPLAITPEVTYGDPTCDTAGTVTPVESDGIRWVSNEDGSFTAYITDPALYEWSDPTQARGWNFPAPAPADPSDESCAPPANPPSDEWGGHTPTCGMDTYTETGTRTFYKVKWSGEAWVHVVDRAEPISREVTDPQPDCPLPPAADAEVVCVSTGPDYVAWQLTNTGDVDIVSPVALVPGEFAVVESLFGEEGSVTITVSFANETTANFTGSGEGCVFVPPVTPDPEDTTTTTDPDDTTSTLVGGDSGERTTTTTPGSGGPTTTGVGGGSGTLPATGSSSAMTALLGSVLLLFGGTVLFAGRRQSPVAD